MKKNILTDQQKEQFENKLFGVWSVYDAMNRRVDSILQEYAQNEYYLAIASIHPDKATLKRNELSVKAKQTAMEYASKAVEEIKKVKSEYLDAVMPGTYSKMDITEIALLERELSVMTSDELDEYYSENWLDSTKGRLSVIEIKKRNNYKDGKSTYVTFLDKESHEDAFINQINEFLSFSNGIVQAAQSSMPYVYDPIGPKIAPINWDLLFREIYLRNLKGELSVVSLASYKDPSFGRRTDQEVIRIVQTKGANL